MCLELEFVRDIDFWLKSRFCRKNSASETYWHGIREKWLKPSKEYYLKQRRIMELEHKAMVRYIKHEDFPVVIAELDDKEREEYYYLINGGDIEK